MAGADAQAGFYYQNVVAAGWLLDLIENGSAVRSVSLESSDRAKFVDDIIVECVDKTLFVQVKWAKDDSSALTLHNLLAAEEPPEMPLIAKLAAGFEKIHGEPGAKQILLLSTRKPGTNRQPTKLLSRSLHDFLFELHGPFTAGPSSADIRSSPRFPEYKDILDQMWQASGFTTFEEFNVFLHQLRFSLGQPDRESVERSVRAKLSRLGIAQVHYGTLLDRVVKWSIAHATVKAGDVLDGLGLADHFTDPINHHFPVDREQWVPTPTVFRALDQSLQTLKSGFVLLEGEPGIGKSTLLAEYARRRKDVTLAYHCYVPDERALGNDRLEQNAFVRSMCIGLSRAFPDEEFPRRYEDYSLELLNLWLRHVSERNQRAVFIVDGIDHVHSKHLQSVIAEPLTSVLDNLPPDNVLIVVSSQILAALPPSVQDHITSDPRRYIRVPRFVQSQVKDFLARRGIELNADNLALAQDVSGGVPVYLEYLATCLAERSEYEREEFLKRQPTLRDDTIDAYHRYLWRSLESDQMAANLLAILANRDDFTMPGDLAEMLGRLHVPATDLSVERTLRLIGHVLRKSQGQAVAIRHNSFREFVLEQTRPLAPTINEILVDWYAAHSGSDEAWRHRFRHLFHLGKFEELKNELNHDWFAASWMAHRPISEIHRNIDFAWQAAAITRDLTSFVRVALIKQRLALVEYNLQLRPEQIAGFLIDSGLAAEGLRCVWDGERIRCSTVSFARFCLHYRERFGVLPPRPTLDAALADPPIDCSSADLTTYYRASTFVRSSLEMLREISRLSWIVRSEHKATTKQVSEADRNATNLRTQLAVIRELCDSKNLAELVQIERIDSALPPEVCEYGRAAHALLLARIGETDEARTVAATVKFAGIPETDRRTTLLALADHGIWDPAWFTEHPPDLPVEFVEQHLYRELEPKFFSLYDRLRSHFLSISEGKAWFDSVLTGLPEPNRSVVHALGKLALLWADWVKGGCKTVAALSPLQQIATEFDLPPDVFDLLDSGRYLARNLYRQDSSRFFSSVWSAAARILTQDDFLALGEWWGRSDAGQRAGRNAGATRDFAVHLAARLDSAADEVSRALLSSAERTSRRDQETSVLASEIFATATAWGRSGFQTDAARLWRELLDLGCGIGDRKDYQFNEILTPLRLAHERNPGATRKRIADQLALAHRLEGAARSKTAQVAIEDLIVFASRISLGLPLQMLAREEDSIYRERALNSLVREWIETPEAPLSWLWALASSTARWDDYAEYNDHVLPMREAIFAEALARKEFATAENIYRDARRVFLVEKGTRLELVKWARMWTGAGNTPADVSADLQIYGNLVLENESNSKEFSRLFSPDPQLLTTAAAKGVPALEELLDQLARRNLTENWRGAIERVFPDWLEVFSASLGRELTPDDRSALNSILNDAGGRIGNFTPSDRDRNKDAIRRAASGAISAMANKLGRPSLVEDLSNSFDLERWLDRLPLVQTSRAPHQGDLEKLLPDWIARAPMSDLDAWEELCRKRFNDECRATGLFAVARRVRSLDPERAKALLQQAWESHAGFFFEYRKLSNDVFSEIISLDEQLGCEILLKAFLVQHQRFPATIVHRLDRVLDHAHRFPGVDFDEIYNLWAEYNENLTIGLSAPPLNLNWFLDAAEAPLTDEILGYLVWLLEYPVVDVRLLTVGELHRLLSEGATTPDALLAHWKSSSAAQKEILAAVLFVFALSKPDATSNWAQSLLALAAREPHFNLRRTVSDAILTANQCGAVLEAAILDEARRLQVPPAVARPLRPVLVGVKPSRIPPYPLRIMKQLARFIPAEQLFPRIESQLALRYASRDEGFAEETATHRSYNINDNFDTIEISGTYDAAVRESINVTLHELLEAHTLDDPTADAVAGLVRVADPTDHLMLPVVRPPVVEWIDMELDDAEFLSFGDWDRITRSFCERHSAWYTVFEHTEQRIGNGYGPRRRATRVRARAVAVVGSQVIPTQDDVNETAIIFGNRYRFELRQAEARSPGSPGPQVLPLVQISTRTFRSRHHLEIAALRPTLARELGLEIDPSDWLGYSLAGRAAVRSTTWQEPFDQGRRRHEPRSAGFLLEASADVLTSLTTSHNWAFWVQLAVHRTTNQYEPESKITWSHRSELFRLPIPGRTPDAHSHSSTRTDTPEPAI